MNHGNSSHPKYRPDIDGLRAVAVLSVLFFHISPHFLSGGYAGVDVFFVISGFLISTIIFKSLDQGTFSFLDFYSRRIRRIFPSLIVTILVTLLFGWFILLPEEFNQLAKHAAASIAFVQNFVLWKESGYFDSSSDLKPLLHIWSLGIEEQFYFIWPVFLYIFSKMSRAQHRKYLYLMTMLTVFITSFILSLGLVKVDPTKTFYLPQYRFWELSAGGLLAWVHLYSKRFNQFVDGHTPLLQILKSFLSFLGLTILAFVFLTYDNTTVFPGINALAPVIAVVFIITAGAKAFSNRLLLSHSTMVAIGLISYPLYLWHWPLLSFGRIIYSGEPSLAFKFFAAFCSFLLASLSLKFVETPFRLGNKLSFKTSLLSLAAALLGVFGFLSYQWLPSSIAIPEHQKHIQSRIIEAKSNCENFFPEWFESKNNSCAMEDIQSSIVIIGDSHANHLYPGLLHTLETSSENVSVFSASCAAPLLDVATALNDPKLYEFRKNNYLLKNKALLHAAQNPSVHTVILAHHPNCSLGSGNAQDIENPEEKNAETIIRTGLRRTLKFFAEHDKQVIIALDTPFVPFNPHNCMRKGFLSKGFDCSFEDHSEARLLYNQIALDVIKNDFPAVKVLDLSALFCKLGKCSPLQNGRLMYADPSHLNIDGSLLVAPYLIHLMNRPKDL